MKRSSFPTMENVLCSCNKCGEELGCFRNAWNGIGNTYFSPIYPPASARDGFVTTNSIYKGTQDTQIENSYLQDLACKGCGDVLGLRCDSSPEGHFLKRNQLILRLAAMSVISERTGQKATVSVIERFHLRLPGMAKPPRARRASTAQPGYRGGTPSLTNHKQAANSALTHAMDERQERELEKFKDWAKDAIQAQQNHIDRIGGAFDRMERDLNSFKAFMEETRAELAALRQFRDNLKDEELAPLKRDINVIQAELSENRQFKNSLRDEEFPVLQEDIDALRSELSQTQNSQRQLKLQDIKTLQQNLDELRRNVERIAYLAEDGPKVPYEKFETLVDDVREVDRKARDVVSVRAELEQFKSRLTSMETSMLEAVPSRNIATFPVERTRGKVAQTASYRENENPILKTSHLSKRKHLQVDDNTNSAYEPPTKRPTNSTAHATSILSSGNTSSKSLTVRFHTRDSPILLSSNHGTPSPVPHQPDSRRDRNGESTIKHSIQFPDLGRNNSRGSRKVESKGGTSSSTTHVTPNYVLERTAHNAIRNESAGTHLSFNGHNKSSGIISTQKSGERSDSPSKSSSSKGTLKARRLRQRSDTPDQLSTPFAEGAMLKSVQKRHAARPKGKTRDSFGAVSVAPIDSDSPLPSIEDNTEQKAIQVPVPISSISSRQTAPSIATDPHHPFACSECGKHYKFVANLERHKVISNRCRVGKEATGSAPKTDEETAKKKRKMKERERLATELLAKQ